VRCATRRNLLIVTLLGVLLSACSSAPPSRPEAALPGEAELLSGRALFGAPVSADEIPEADVRGLDDAMREFVDRAVSSAWSGEARLRHLLRAMLGSGLFALDYEGELTLTAQETFHARAGNCLAFTNLFVALAREARLQAFYQEVDVPALWSGDGDYSLLIQHVNVLVRETPSGWQAPREHVVDFNLPNYRGAYPQRLIDDQRVDALFYNNLGVEALRAGDHRSAFVYLLKAMREDPGTAAAWGNLGVLYLRNDLPEHAESAFHRALRAERGNKPAMSNLANLYDQRGDAELAEAYRARIRRHNARNPYYQLQLAERAYAEGRVEDGLDAINHAIRLNADEHRFHYMRALLLAQAGRLDASRASLERARDTAAVAQVQAVYERKLRELP
jgi:Flp pilus assembly protein TadD